MSKGVLTMCRNPEQPYLERAVEEYEIEQAYDWFYDRYTPEEQVELLPEFETNPIRFVEEARCAV
jgi:hypothetical protein